LPKPQPSVLKRLKEQKRHEKRQQKAEKRAQRQSERREEPGAEGHDVQAQDGMDADPGWNPA
jgi:hypothetical protein